MALQTNPNGTLTLTDDTGKLPPLTVDQQQAQALGLYNPPAAPPPPTLAMSAGALAQTSGPQGAGGASAGGNPADFSATDVPGAPISSEPAPVMSEGAGTQGNAPPAPPPVPATGPTNENAVGVPPTDLAAGPSAAPLVTPSAPGAVMGAGPGAAGVAAPGEAEYALYEGATRPRPAIPGGVIPEHDVLRSISVQKGLPPLSDETRGMIEKAYAQRAAATEVAGAQEAAIANRTAELYAQEAKNANVRLADMRTEQRQQQGELRQRMAVLDTHLNALNSQAQQDPIKAYWAEKGSSAQVMSQIGIALGALGGAMSGRPNEVLQQVNADLDRVLERQKMLIEGGFRSAELEKSALGQMTQTMLSPEAAENAARALMLGSVENEINAMKALSTSEQARSNADKMLADIAMQKAEWRARSEEAEADKIAQQWAHKERQVVGGAPAGKPTIEQAMNFLMKKGGLSAKDAIKVLNRQGVNAPETNPRAEMQKELDRLHRRVFDPDTGLELYSGHTEGIDKLRDKFSTTEQYIANLDRIKELAAPTMAGVPYDSLPTGTRQRIEAIIAENRYLLKPSLLGEALTVGELENYAPLTGEKLHDFFAVRENQMAGLEQAKTQALNRLESARRSMFVLDPNTGQEVPYALSPRAKEPPGFKKEK